MLTRTQGELFEVSLEPITEVLLLTDPDSR